MNTKFNFVKKALFVVLCSFFLLDCSMQGGGTSGTGLDYSGPPRAGDAYDSAPMIHSQKPPLKWIEVRGKIVDENGTVLARVEISASNHSAAKSTVSDSQGNFLLKLPSDGTGKFKLLVMQSDGVPLSRSFSASPGGTLWIDLVVKSGGSVDFLPREGDR